MYAIYLRGRREPVAIDDVVGRLLQEKWANGSLGKVVNIQGLTFDKDMIRAIEANYRDVDGAHEVKQREIRDAQAERAKSEQDWARSMARKASLPVEEKAKDLDLARMVWFAHTMKFDIPEEVVPEIIERQMLWLRENPKNAYANPMCYRDIVEKNKRVVQNSPFIINAMEFVARVMMADNSRASKV